MSAIAITSLGIADKSDQASYLILHCIHCYELRPHVGKLIPSILEYRPAWENVNIHMIPCVHIAASHHDLTGHKRARFTLTI